MSNHIPPGNRLHRDKALFGTDKGQHGPVKILVKDGKPVDQVDKEAEDVYPDWLTKQQELKEQDYLKRA